MAYRPTVADRILGSAALRRRQWVGRTLSRVVGEVVVDGLENLPARGPVVLAMNHVAFLDGPLLFAAVRRPITFLVKAEAFTPRLGPVLYGAGQLPVRRGQVDAAPIRLSLRILGGGGVVGVFPEGARGDGRVRTVRPGVAYLAMRTGAVVVPVASHGTQLVGHQARPHVRITLGEPIEVPHAAPGTRLNRRAVAAQAERVRVALADLVERTAESTPAASAHSARE